MKILGIIPARGGSKGVPGKNIKLLNGKPLLAYTAKSALTAKGLTKVVLSTDDTKIADIGRSLGLEVPFLRPADLAQDSSPTLPVIQHALDFYEKLGEKFDAVCLLEATSPFRYKGLIDDSISRFQSLDADALVSVLPIPATYNPHWSFEPDSSGYLHIATGETTIIPRRQELPKAFHRDGAIYLTKSNIIKEGSLYGRTLAFLENNSKCYVNIDTQQDWDEAEHWLTDPSNLSLLS